jgi:hypothetical protein
LAAGRRAFYRNSYLLCRKDVISSEPAGRSPALDQARLRRGESRNLFLNGFLHFVPTSLDFGRNDDGSFLQCNFYSQITKNTNKKRSRCFSNRLRLLKVLPDFYSPHFCFRRKLWGLACWNLSCRPPPVPGIFAVNLPHTDNIKPTSSSFVKKNHKNFGIGKEHQRMAVR